MRFERTYHSHDRVERVSMLRHSFEKSRRPNTGDSESVIDHVCSWEAVVYEEVKASAREWLIAARNAVERVVPEAFAEQPWVEVGST